VYNSCLYLLLYACACPLSPAAHTELLPGLHALVGMCTQVTLKHTCICLSTVTSIYMCIHIYAGMHIHLFTYISCRCRRIPSSFSGCNAGCLNPSIHMSTHPSLYTSVSTYEAVFACMCLCVSACYSRHIPSSFLDYTN